MNDLQLAKELADMGYDLDLDLDSGKFDISLLVELAVSEGFKWCNKEELWN